MQKTILCAKRLFPFFYIALRNVHFFSSLTLINLIGFNQFSMLRPKCYVQDIWDIVIKISETLYSRYLRHCDQDIWDIVFKISVTLCSRYLSHCVQDIWDIVFKISEIILCSRYLRHFDGSLFGLCFSLESIILWNFIFFMWIFLNVCIPEFLRVFVCMQKLFSQYLYKFQPRSLGSDLDNFWVAANRWLWRFTYEDVFFFT